MILLITLLLFSTITNNEMEERIRLDFNKKTEDILPYIHKYYPNADSTDIKKWEDSKALEFMYIDGEKFYFRNAAANLFRIDTTCKRIKESIEGEEKSGRKEIIKNHITDVLNEYHNTKNNLLVPHKVTFHYTLTINDTSNAKEHNIWLPYPRVDNKRQTDVNHFSSKKYIITTNTTHSNAYIKTNNKKHNKYKIKYKFKTYAEYHPLPSDIKHIQADTTIFKEYITERAPHIIFSEKIKNKTDSIVGDETRPYYQARKIFESIRKEYPWASAREYSTIENIPEYVIEQKHGDCGQVTLLFITMCRYKKIPARWQSGFMLHPGYENLHDWAEIYIEGMGWIPVDPSFGVQDWGKTDAEKYFYFGGIDAYRMIVNSDWGGELSPKKKYSRSENVDFQRGECESEKRNYYFNEWNYSFKVKTKKIK